MEQFKKKKLPLFIAGAGGKKAAKAPAVHRLKPTIP